MKLRVLFNFYNILLEVRCHDERHVNLISWLEEDFNFFALPEESPGQHPVPQISITVERELKEKVLFPFIKTRMCLTYGWWNERICFYDSSTILYQQTLKSQRVAQIKGVETEYLYEIIYTYILSSVGEALEKKGMMRFHALGVEKNSKARFYVLPSRGGKSTLAYQLLNETDLKIYSDEIVLYDGEKVYPFPVRIALADPPTKSKRMFKRKVFEDKWIFPLPSDRVASPHALQAAYAPGFFYFLWVGFWGLGVPQMAEFLLRFPSVWSLFKMALKRQKLLLKILFSKKFKRIKKKRLALDNIS